MADMPSMICLGVGREGGTGQVRDVDDVWGCHSPDGTATLQILQEVLCCKLRAAYDAGYVFPGKCGRMA